MNLAKSHLAVAINTHQIITAELSASNVINGEVLLNFLQQSHRKINKILGSCTCDIIPYYETIHIKQLVLRIPLRKETIF
ncbi:hypothetical protein [Candidatus Enterovibrio altilux]|nr:hypothetical protein [Candidatus Enterovibrio luxaltus]